MKAERLAGMDETKTGKDKTRCTKMILVRKVLLCFWNHPHDEMIARTNLCYHMPWQVFVGAIFHDWYVRMWGLRVPHSVHIIHTVHPLFRNGILTPPAIIGFLVKASHTLYKLYTEVMYLIPKKERWAVDCTNTRKQKATWISIQTEDKILFRHLTKPK